MQITLLTLTILFSAPTVEVAGVEFSKSLKSTEAPLELAGASGFTYALVFDVLSGGIYLPEGTPASDFSKATTKALVLAYKRDFSSEELREVTANLFTENNPSALVDEVQSELKLFNSFYRDIKAGDRYQLTLREDQGIELSLNGNSVGRVKNSKFGSAVFNIWFGDRPFSRSFRDKLLKGI